MKYLYHITMIHGEYYAKLDEPLDLARLSLERWITFEDENGTFCINIAQIVNMRMKTIPESES